MNNCSVFSTRQHKCPLRNVIVYTSSLSKEFLFLAVSNLYLKPVNRYFSFFHRLSDVLYSIISVSGLVSYESFSVIMLKVKRSRDFCLVLFKFVGTQLTRSISASMFNWKDSKFTWYKLQILPFGPPPSKKTYESYANLVNKTFPNVKRIF